MKINAYQRLVLHSIGAVLKLQTKNTTEFREIPRYIEDCVRTKTVDADFLERIDVIKKNMEIMGGLFNR